MAELFTLLVTDNSESIDFISSTFKVADGGFDIGTPESVRELTEIRPGFFRLVKNQKKYRTATITFAIHGATRPAVLTSLAKLERVITSIESQEYITDTARGQLAYAFEGASQQTYFEAYAGDIVTPTNLLSVEVAHAQDGSGYYIPGLQLVLYLSPQGYGLSIYDEPGSGLEIPLYNPTVASAQTGGVNVKNPGTGNYSYVQIDADDVMGAQPYITVIELVGQSSGWSAWQRVYIGKQHYPYPSQLVFDDSDVAGGADPGSVVSNVNANDGQYRTNTYSGEYIGTFADYTWAVPSGMRGMFYAFLVNYLAAEPNAQFAVGIDDYVRYGIRSISEYVQPASSTQRHLPIAPIQLPPVGLDVEDFGTLHEDLWIGVFTRANSLASGYSWDYMHLLPISNGVRVWVRRRNPGHTVLNVDNPWRGLVYNKDTSTGKVWSGFYGMMPPLTITPGKDQRFYFAFPGLSTSPDERDREFQVKIWGIPTFSTLAY